MSHTTVSTRNAVLLLLAVCILPTAPALAESVLIKRKFDPSRPCYIEQVTTTHNVTVGSPMGDKDATATDTRGVWEKTSSAVDGKTKIEWTFDRVAHSLSGETHGSGGYDTDDPDHPEAAIIFRSIFKTMLGMSMTAEIDKKGEVVSFTGMDAIEKAISKSVVANMAWYGLAMSGEFTDEQAKQRWGTDPLLIYPNKKVKVGDTWDAEAPMNKSNLGTIDRHYDYKLEKFDKENGRKVAVISFSATMTLQKNEGAAAPGRPKPGFNGSLTGKAIYDIDLGRIVLEKTEGVVKTKITFPPRSEEGKPTTMTVDVDVKSTTRVLSEKARKAQILETQKKAKLRKLAEEEA